MKILLVEDDPGCASITRERLATGGIPVEDLHHVTTLHEAANKVMLLEPDVILFDLGLPDSTTDNTIEAIKAFSRFPVVVLTGFDNPQFWKRSLTKSGAMDYLHKLPFLAKGNEGFLAHAILNSVWKHTVCRD